MEHNPTPEQLAEWEQQYPGLKKVQVDDGKLVCFKRPGRALVGAASSTLSQTKDPVKYADILLKNCQLNWQEATAKEDDLYFALMPFVDSLINAKTAELVK